MKKFKILLPGLLLIFISSCAGVKFNQRAQDQNKQIQSLTAQTIELSKEDYTAHSAQVQTLKAAFDAAIAFETARGKTNFPTVNMWKQVSNWVNVDFANTWKNQGKLRPTAVREVKKRSDKLFDYIINLEDNKIKR